MPVKSDWIRYGDQRGFFAYPENATKPLPTVIVIQEIWGVEQQIEDVTRRIAAAGYAALAPDLFLTGGERPAALSVQRIAQTQAFGASLPPGAWTDPSVREAELAKLPEKQRTEINETFAQIYSFPARLPSLVPALREAVRHVRHERPETTGAAIGCVGFCMGGGLSALLACEEENIDAAVVYYGNAPDAGKITSISCPVLAFYGEKDQRVNAGIPAFESSMKSAGKSFEYHIYPGANHGFFNEIGKGYNVAAARDSFWRLLEFFQKHLVT